MRPLLGLLVSLALVGWSPPAATAHAHLPTTRTTSPTREVNAPVSVSGAPRSLVSLVVPVPVQLEGEQRLSFSVEISGRVEVLGRQYGDLNVLPGQPHRPVLLTIRVPAEAHVGLLDVADIVFSAEDGRQVVVPIILRVPSVLAIRMTGQRELQDVAAGDRVELVYRVQNLGNTPETFTVALQVPADWRRTLPRTLSVPPFGSAELPVSLRVAPGAAGNDHIVAVSLLRAGADTAIATVSTVLRSAPEVIRPTGLRLDPFVAVAATANGTGASSGLRLEGPLSDGIRVMAQASPLPAVGQQDAVLAQIGAVRLPFFAAVTAESWAMQAGATQLSVNELAGVNLGGRGVTATYDDGARTGSLIVARPGFDGRDDGLFLGASAGRYTALGQFTGFASTLRQETAGFALRELTAFGADYTTPAFGSLQLSGGAALRAHAGGNSMGLRAQLAHERDGESLRLRVLHAPGGSGAFAMQSDEVILEGRRQFTARLSVSGDAYRNADRGGQFADVFAHGVSAGPRLMLGARSMIGLRAFVQENEVRPNGVGVGRFGTDSRGVSVNAHSTQKGWDLQSDVTTMSVNRTAQLFSGALDEVRALQTQASVTGHREVAALGQVGLGASLQVAESGVGLPQRAGSVFGRWTGLPVFVFGQLVLAESEVRVYTSDVGGAQTAMKLGARTQFRNGLAIDGSLSRSPFIRDANGRAGWVAALRVAVTTEVLAGDRLRAPGTVFLDENGDGRRNPEERGVSGVEIRYGNTRVSTGRDGRYRLPANLRGRIQVDARTLPRGFVVAPSVALDTVERRDIPLVATGTRDVQLQLEADAELRVPDVDLAKADVWLRDENGFEWVGEHVEGGRFRFSEVPVGRYVVRLGFSRLEEPVRADEPTVDIQRGSDQPVVISVRGRSVRIISPPRGGRGGAGVAPRVAPRLTGKEGQ
ncbi:MAG TPA: hypothetical protein PLY94_05750 [Gemmatimonadaceae bacterium]|nr:hypothetical protein [Gemmatimonadaceae bacterium]